MPGIMILVEAKKVVPDILVFVGAQKVVLSTTD